MAIQAVLSLYVCAHVLAMDKQDKEKEDSPYMVDLNKLDVTTPVAEDVVAHVTALYAQCEVKVTGLARAGELYFCFLCMRVLCELLF